MINAPKDLQICGEALHYKDKYNPPYRRLCLTYSISVIIHGSNTGRGRWRASSSWDDYKYLASAPDVASDEE